MKSDREVLQLSDEVVRNQEDRDWVFKLHKAGGRSGKEVIRTLEECLIKRKLQILNEIR